MASSDLLTLLSIEPALDTLASRRSSVPDFDMGDMNQRLDDAVFAGSMFYDSSVPDASFDATMRVPKASPFTFTFSGQDLDEESVESIFDDLHESCAPAPSTSPLVLPGRPFRPWQPADVVTPPPSPLTQCEFVDLALASAVVSLQAQRIAEDDGSEDESDLSEDTDSDSDDDIAADADFAPVSVPRTIRSLPGRVIPKASGTTPSSRRGAVPSSAPAASSRKSKKRQARRATGPRATKKAAVSSRTSTATPTAQPVVSAPAAKRPANSAGVPDIYLHLLTKGCTVSGRGMVCNVGGCTQRTANFADMERHNLTHYPKRKACEGCPGTFARTDSLTRHVGRQGEGHNSDERIAFLKSFNKLPVVVKMRTEAGSDNASQGKLNFELCEMFEALLENHTAAVAAAKHK